MKRILCRAALFALCALPLAAPARQAPNLQLKDAAGKSHKIADLRGSVAVVNFWATWCGPCREELPMLDRLASAYSARGVRFIAISADEDRNRPQLERFLAANKLGMDVWTGANLYMLDRAELGRELPATMILDTDGNIITRVLGEAREPELQSVLDWLLGGRQGTPPPAVFHHE